MVDINKQINTYEMIKNDYKCVEETTTFLVIGKSFKIERFDTSSGELLGNAVENAYGASGGFFKVTAMEDTTADFYQIDAGYELSEPDPTQHIRNPLITIPWKGTIKNEFTMTGQQTINYIILYSTNEYTVTVDSSDYYAIGAAEEYSTGHTENTYTDTQQVVLNPKWLVEETEPTGSDLSAYISLSVEIDTSKLSEYWPKKAFYLKEGNIYSDKTIEELVGESDNPNGPNNNPEGDPEDDPEDKLSAGEIAGIVVGCVVVVGAISFCIIWFAVLKKGCSFS